MLKAASLSLGQLTGQFRFISGTMTKMTAEYFIEERTPTKQILRVQLATYSLYAKG